MQTKYKFNHSLFIFGLMILFFIAAFPLVQAQTAAPGDLDTTFGSGGKVITRITSEEDYPTRVRIQPDGKIVTVGVVAEGGFGFPTNSFLVRHNANGTVDNSFGTNGSVVVNFDNGDILFLDFVILPDGKLLVTANKCPTSCGTPRDLVIYRYTANGTPDATFGTNGVITTTFSSGFVNGGRIVLQPDGKFVVASYAGSGGVAVVRYNPNGTLDTTFGTSGITQTSVENSTYPGVSEILVQTDGKLLVAGSARFGSNGNIFVLRYNPNGELDTSFGANGIVQTDVDNQYNAVGGMALQPDGKIIVNGSNYTSNFPFTVNFLSSSIVRYNANGTLDNTFGANGIVRITEPQSQSYRVGIARALAIQQNGKILTAGERNRTFAISRYNSNGTIDTSFGTNGVVITPIGNSNQTVGISSIALQTDGKIVAAGAANYDVGLVRYLGDAVTTTTRRTLFDFDGDGRSDISVFRPSEGVWYLNRSGSGFTAAQFGLSTDKITPADFDGDGKTDIAVFRDGVWYWLNSSNGNFNAVQFGVASDIPVPADYTGDGRAELAVYRGGFWYTLNLANNQFQGVQFGVASDKPVPADYDGDGKTDIAVARQGGGVSTWYILGTSRGFYGLQFGTDTDKLVPADFDGDGKADMAVYRNGFWYVLGSTQGFYGVQFGNASDIPVAADYDGDGKADIAVYRDGIWYMLRSQQGFGAVQFGTTNDQPIPAAFVP